MDGFGPVGPKKMNRYLHADWERRMYACAECRDGRGAGQHRRVCRHAIERIPPRVPRVELVRRGLAAAEHALVERGVGTREELARKAGGRSTRPGRQSVAKRPAPIKKNPGSKPTARPGFSKRWIAGAARNLNLQDTRGSRATCAQGRSIARDWGSVRLPRYQRASCWHQAATLAIRFVRRARAVGANRRMQAAASRVLIDLGRLFGTDRGEVDGAQHQKKGKNEKAIMSDHHNTDEAGQPPRGEGVWKPFSRRRLTIPRRSTDRR